MNSRTYTCAYMPRASHMIILILTHKNSHSTNYTRSHSLKHSNTHTHTVTLTLHLHTQNTHTHTYTHTRSHHSPSQKLTRTLTTPRSHSRAHSQPLTLTLTTTHSHSQFPEIGKEVYTLNNHINFKLLYTYAHNSDGDIRIVGFEVTPQRSVYAPVFLCVRVCACACSPLFFLYV